MLIAASCMHQLWHIPDILTILLLMNIKGRIINKSQKLNTENIANNAVSISNKAVNKGVLPFDNEPLVHCK